MAKELALQTDIKNSAKRDGGYGLKLSNRFTVGVPDLLLMIPPVFAPVVVEVKDLGPVTANFNRQLDVTPLQAETMRRMSSPYEDTQTRYTPSRRSAFLLVGFSMDRDHYLVVLPRDTERLSYLCLAEPASYTKRGKGGYYALQPLFKHVGALEIKLL